MVGKLVFWHSGGKMKVGDLVRQNPNNGLVKIKNHKSVKMDVSTIGTVIAIKEGIWPTGWQLSSEQKKFALKIGRRVDVLWSNGKISENFAESVLEVVKDEIPG